MEIWNAAARLLTDFLAGANELFFGALILIEESGVPLPVPGDAIVVYAGYRVGRGQASLPLMLVALEVATLCGGSLLYWVGIHAGRPIAYRYGRYLHVSGRRLDAAGALLSRHGTLAIFAGRLIPGCRFATSLAAGVLGLPYRRFLPGLVAGSTVHLSILLLAGMAVGPSLVALVERVGFSFRVVVTTIMALALGAVMVTVYRRAAASHPHAPRERGWETPALAGMIAMMEMVLVVDLSLYVLTGIGLATPELALERLTSRIASAIAGPRQEAGTALFLAFVFAGGVLWAELYTRVAIDRLPGPGLVRGLVFGVAPFAASVLVVLPLVGAGPLGLDLGAGALPVVAEGLRCAVFGAALGATYEILLDARAPRITAGDDA